MAREETLRVKGLTSLVRACRAVDKQASKQLREALREAAGPVKTDAVRRMDAIDARSAAGYRIYVRQRGVGVEQSLRKTTGRHPEYGKLQMRRALLPALAANVAETQERVERALTELEALWEREP